MKQNIIVFLSDQQRFDTLGCNGQSLNVTPNLDKYSEEAVNFKNAFTVQPVCGPARACLQTGLYPTQSGCFRNSISLPEDRKTLAKYMTEAGYDVAYVGKWHLASDGDTSSMKDEIVPPVQLEKRGGYDGYWMVSDLLELTSHGYNGFVYDRDNNRVDFEGYRADCITDFALDFIKEYNKEKPFFLFISHIEPHHQNDRCNFEAPHGSREKFEDYSKPADLETGKGDWEQFLPDYLGCCNSLDYNFGRLVELLKNKGIYDDTTIIYTSDHGCHFRTLMGEAVENGYDDYKRNSFDNTIHIPMIIKGEGFEPGKNETRLVHLLDLPRTIMTLAGCKNISEDIQGRPLCYMTDEEEWDNSVYIQISESYVGRVLRTEKYKYVIYDPEKDPWNEMLGKVYKERYLFDIVNDPLEKRNLINDSSYGEIKREMRRKIKEYALKAGEGKLEIEEA